MTLTNTNGGTITFTGNTANSDGAINGSNVSISSGVIFTDNKATGTTSGAGVGGAIFAGGNVTIGSGVTFTGNEAGFYGGAIFLTGTTLSLDGTLFQNNMTYPFGGALATHGGAIYSKNIGHFKKSATQQRK